ncbi:MAG: hypothetical protein SNJ69_17720 [Chloroflexaceae bacterium]
MSALHGLSNRQHLLITALAVPALAAVIVLLFATISTAAASILSLLIIVATLALHAMMTARATPRVARAQPASGPAVPPLLLTLASGEVLVAREVDLGHPDEHRLLLTRKGYMLVNAAGEVIYQL